VRVCVCVCLRQQQSSTSGTQQCTVLQPPNPIPQPQSPNPNPPTLTPTIRYFIPGLLFYALDAAYRLTQAAGRRAVVIEASAPGGDKVRGWVRLEGFVRRVLGSSLIRPSVPLADHLRANCNPSNPTNPTNQPNQPNPTGVCLLPHPFLPPLRHRSHRLRLAASASDLQLSVAPV